MFAYEIEKWMEGVTLRRQGWPDQVAVKFVQGRWEKLNGDKVPLSEYPQFFNSDDWEVYTPCLEKKKITLCRYLIKNSSGEYALTGWTTSTPMILDPDILIDVQTMEQEVNQ